MQCAVSIYCHAKYIAGQHVMAHDAVDGAPAHIAMKNTNMFKKYNMI